MNGLKSIEEPKKFPKAIPAGGELVLGQASRDSDMDDSFNDKFAFIGGMSFVNIYKRILTEEEVNELCINHVKSVTLFCLAILEVCWIV